MKHTFVIITTAASLISCKPAAEQAQEEAPKKHLEPWEWVPTSAELLAGKQVYLDECSGCHNEGEEGAPALIDTDEWTERKAKGLATLTDHAINGYIGSDGEMPARGGTPSLTDAKVISAVQFMIESPKEKHK